MKNPQDVNLTSRTQPWIIMLASAALMLPLSPQGSAYAADFRHAKKIIVPPSAIPRRYDYDSMSGTVADPSGNRANFSSGNGSSSYATPPPPANYTFSYPSSTQSTPIKSKNGLVPPPPPVAPGLLPSSMADSLPSLPQKAADTNTGPKRFSPHARRFDPNLHPYGKGQAISNTSESTSRILAKAQALEANGHLKDAQDLLKKNLKSHPENRALKDAITRVSNERAKYYLRKDQFKDAAGQARIALKYSDENKTASSLLNQSLRHQGIDPLNSLSRLKEGQLLFTQGKLEEAEVEYKSSNALKPNAEANIGLGNIAFNNGHLKNAKESYQKALKLSPHSSVAMRQLGITRYKLSDVVGANADLTRALVQDPEDKLASHNLIDLWQRQVATRPNDANSHLGLARAYQLSGDLDSAKNEYRAVVKIDPEHPSLPQARQSFKLALARKKAEKAYLAGQTLYAHQAFREAFDKASEAVRLSPGNTEYKIFQAGILEKLGDLTGAKQAYLTILQDDPKNIQAAKRIQVLNLLLARGSQTQMPVYPTQQILSGSQPQYRGEGPALAYLPGPYAGGTYKAKAQPGPTADPVQNMTGFLGSLRNLMQNQKKVLEADESRVLENLGYKTASSAGSLSSAAAITGSSAMPAPVTVDNAGIEKVLADAKAATLSAGGAASSSLSAADTATSAPQSWTEMAIAAGQSLSQNPKFQSLTQAAATSAPSILNNLSTNSALTAGSNPYGNNYAIRTAPAIVRQANNGPPLAPPIGKSQTDEIASAAGIQSAPDTLEEQNRLLASKLSEAQKQIALLKSSQQTTASIPEKNEDFSESVEGQLEPAGVSQVQATQAINTPVVIPQGIKPVDNIKITDNGIEQVETPKLRPAVPTSVPEGIKPVDNIKITENGIEQAETPKLRPAVPTSVPEGIKPVDNIKFTESGITQTNVPNLRGAIPASSQKQVHLELLGVKASSKKIRLKVRLRNEQNKDLEVPRSKKAVIRMAGVPDKEVKIDFPKKLLKANSSMEGYISVPGKRLSPAADVFIPELANPNQNIHLTTPISSLPQSH